jgi:hypothetical protein
MAELNKQTLLHYRTSGQTMPSVDRVKHGEIVVMYNTDTPKLIIKNNDGKLVSFVDEAAVVNKINVLQTNIEGSISSFSGEVETKFAEYATSADTVNAIASAKTEAVADAKSYTDTEVSSAKTALTGAINGVAGDLATLSGDVETKFGEYATSANTEAAIASAQTAAEKHADDAVASAKTELTGAIEAVAGDVEDLTKEVSDLETELKSEIAAKVSSAYIFKGSKATYEELPAAGTEGLEVGHVYHVVAAHNNVPAGTNWAWTGEEWDALAGEVDLSPYAKTTDVNGEIQRVEGAVNTLSGNVETKFGKYATSADTVTAIADAQAAAEEHADDAVESAKTALTGAINGVAGDLSTLSGNVVTKFGEYATSADTVAAIASAKAEAVASAKSYTDTEVGSAKTALTGAIEAVEAKVDTLSGKVVSDYATSANTVDAIASAKTEAIASAKSYTDTEVSGVTSALNTLSTQVNGRLEALEGLNATTLSAVQSVVVKDENIHQIYASKDAENKVTINFDEMIIDGGEF